MKKIIFIISLVVILLCGCSSGDDKDDSIDAFSLSAEKQGEYKEQITTVLNSFYWRHDENSVSFFSENLPSKSDGEKIYTASKESEYDFENHAGKEAVVATVDLLHFNGDKAGICYLYFLKDNIEGVYYTAYGTNKVYSLKDRNVFKKSVAFKGYESDKVIGDFKSTNTNFPVEGFSSITENGNNGTKMLSLNEKNVRVYRYNGYMSLQRTFSFADELMPLSATFFDDEKIAVLLGRAIYNESEEEREITGTTSEKIVFYDKNYNVISEKPLESTDYSCVTEIEDKLVMFGDNVAEFYDFKENDIVMSEQIYIDHKVTALKSDDVDGDGNIEYIMSDGMDLYLYHKNQVSFVGLWNTHLGIKSLYGYIYTGDLNKDGVKEIYVCDNTGTVIRYALTEKGLKSRNDDIAYGEMIFAADFNNDGYDDYMDCTMGETRYNCKLNISVN